MELDCAQSSLEDIFLIIPNSINILVVEQKGHLSKACAEYEI